MATKGKKKAAPAKKPATKAKKPAAKPKKAAPRAKRAAAAPAVDASALVELEARRADVVRLSGELDAARGQLGELEQLRSETLKSAVELAAAAQQAEEATRRADEAHRRAVEATRFADETGRRAEERERERARLARELEAAHAELAGYKLRCPKCGKSFVEEEYEGITIDRCSGCDAIYFDAGEVDQLIAKVHEKTTSPAADPQETSSWFKRMFKRKPKAEPTGGQEPPPLA